MKARWLAGLALFALGFGSAQLMKVTAADAASGGMVDEGLNIVNHEDRFELVNTGTARYLVVIARKEGVTINPEMESVEGSLTITKDTLVEARISKLEDLGILTNTNPPYRDCHPGFEDCVEPWEPLPRPRPPTPVLLDYQHRR